KGARGGKVRRGCVAGGADESWGVECRRLQTPVQREGLERLEDPPGPARWLDGGGRYLARAGSRDEPAVQRARRLRELPPPGRGQGQRDTRWRVGLPQRIRLRLRPGPRRGQHEVAPPGRVRGPDRVPRGTVIPHRDAYTTLAAGSRTLTPLTDEWRIEGDRLGAAGGRRAGRPDHGPGRW